MTTGGRRSVQVSVLGPVGVRTGGGDVDLGVRLRRLLAALSVAEGSVVSTDSLVEIVWSNEPPRAADRTLRSYVTRLRKAIGSDRSDLIAHQGSGYVLSLHAGELDSAVFERELDDGLQYIRTQEPDAAVRSLTSAIDRWHGPAYSGFAHEDWARPVAVRLEERLIEAREARIDAYLAVGRTEQAVAEAQSLVEAEPLRERSREGLMRALHAAGRQAEALRVFTTYRRFLAEETGLDPSESIVELEGRIARNERGVVDGARAIGGYEIGERIGEGAFAVVHRAVQPGLDRDVAVKIIRAELADRPDFIRRFEHEARTVARIEHPNVVPLIDFWREPGAAYIVMRFLRGGTVEQALQRSGPYSREQLLDLLDDIGGALGAAHHAGVVHRDVRPANLLLDGEGTTYLADFGIAIPTSSSDPMPILSPAYAAPEVLRGEPAGIASDVLSLGVTVFELLTGRLPFADTTDRVELVRRQMDEALPPVRSTRTDLPVGVDEVLARATAKAPADRFATVAALVEALRSELATTPVRHAVATVSTEHVENPYVGLTAFDEPDADRFFGRERLVAELVDQVEDHPLVAVVGPSGSGKSSVVRAGLVPAIRRGGVPGSESWFVSTLVPGSDPFDALETALLRVAVNPPASLREQLSQSGGMLRAIRRVLPDDGARILLVIDQFEELFTMVRDPEVRDRFLTELALVLTAERSPVRIVATLRADHYDAPLRHRDIAELVTAGTVTVRPMTPDELGRAIVEPARAVGVDVEDALTAELVAGISAQPAALPLLQFALTELFDRRAADTMLLSAHHEIGGLTGALAATADRVVERGGPDDEAEIRRIFGRLVTLGSGKEDTRRRAPLSALGDSEQTAWLVDSLVQARLLSTDRDPATREVTVEIAHEALLRDWPRLRRWLDEDRTDLAVLHTVSAAAHDWHQSGADPGALARGARLETAADLARRHPDWLNRPEREWVDASLAAAEAEEAARVEVIERERSQNRRLRSLLGVTAVLLVVALIVGAVSLVLRGRAIDSERAAEAAREEAESQRSAAVEAQNQAEVERTDAQAARDDAESERVDAQAARDDAVIERLVARSAAEANSRPELAVLLALEANRRRDEVETRSAVLGAIATEPRLERVVPAPLVGVTGTTFSADGSTGASWIGGDGVIAVFDGSTGEVVWAPPPIGRSIAFARFSADGSRLAISLVGDRTTVVDVGGTLEAPFEPIREELDGYVLDMDGDGSVVAVGASVFSPDGPAEIVRFVDVASGSPPPELPATRGRRFVELSEAGDVAVVWSQSGRSPLDWRYSVDLVDPATGDRLAQGDADGLVSSVRLLGDGRVVTGLTDGSIHIWGVADDALVLDRRFPAHFDSVSAIAETPGGGLITAGNRNLEFWGADGLKTALPIDVVGSIETISATESAITVVRVADDTMLRFGVTNRPVIDTVVSTGGERFFLAPDLPWYRTIESSQEVRTVRLTPFDGGDALEFDLSDEHPLGIDAFATFSPDLSSMMTLDPFPASGAVVTSIDGAFEPRRFDIEELSERLGGEAFRLTSLRVADGGDQIFLFGSMLTEEKWLAAWFDVTADEFVAGPLEVGVGGAATILDDGRITITSDIFPLAILPAGLDGDVEYVDGATGMRVQHVDHSSGTMLLGGDAGSAALFDPDTRDLRPLRGATGTIAGGAFSPDGDRVALVSRTEGLLLFDVATQQMIGVPIAPGGGTLFGSLGARWSDDASGVWFGPGGGPVRVAADADQWRELACEIAGRELTEDEWASLVSADEPRVPACS